MLKHYIDKLLVYGRALITIGKAVNEAKMLTAKLLIERIAERGMIADVQQAEFKVFSQFGEDGIIQYLIRRAQIMPDEHRVVEFGSDFYEEANTRFLVVNDNWSGLLIDGNKQSIRAIRKRHLFWERDLTAVAAFIDRDNINDIISGGGYSGKIGLLSVDIDGNDYWVWDRLDVVDPVIVVAEYNGLFGSVRAVTIPYDPKFYRFNAHFSGMYYGCSLKALEILGARKGYALVGCNKDGNNCFFVKRDRLNGQPALSAEEAYVRFRYRESRDRQRNFTFTSSFSRLNEIADLPLVDVETGAAITVGDLVV